jgi:Fe-S cluster assembly protein SufD
MNKEIIITERSEKNQTLILDQDCVVFEYLKNDLPEKLKTEIIVKDSIKVDYIFVLENQAKNFVESREIRLGLNSSLRNFYFYLASDANIHLNTHIDGQAKFQQQVLVLASKQNNFYLQENHNFLYPKSQGDFKLFAIAKEQSKIHVDAMVAIKKAAKNTEVAHNQQAWLLSQEAKIELTPSLEVLPNEVKASHSAKVSNLACEQLFYLQSRGLDKASIQNLLYQSIFQLIMNQLPTEKYKENLANILKQYYVNH